jgi:hypothetical protein
MLDFLRKAGKFSERKVRLLAVACCRRTRRYLSDPKSRHAIEVADRHADGLATNEELATTYRGAYQVADTDPLYPPTSPETPGRVEAAPMWAACTDQKMLLDGTVSSSAALDAACGSKEAIGYHVERTAQVSLIRDIFGTPFHRATVEPRWLTPVVVALCNSMCNEHSFYRIRELEEALEAAGCNNRVILEHCRQLQPHVKGCYVVDLLMGKM